MSGFIGKPSIARGNRNFENYFINGRYIKSGLIAKAIEDGYKSYMMQHKYPFTMLHFTVEPEYIDVNVHPSKMELRFKDGEFLYKTVCQMIQGALSGRELIPQVEITGRDEEKKEIGRSGAGSEASGKETSHRAPEPFEKKRMAAMGVLEERSPYGDRRAGTGSRTAEPFAGSGPAPARSGRPRGKDGEARGKAYGLSGTASPANGAVCPGPPGRRAAGQSSRSSRRRCRPAQWSSQSVRPGNRPARQSRQPGSLSLRSIVQNLRPRPQSRWRCSTAACFLKRPGAATGSSDRCSTPTGWWNITGACTSSTSTPPMKRCCLKRRSGSLKSREYTSQFISPPIILTLSMQEEELLKKHMDVFTRVGFEIEPFGGNEYAVRAVPDNLFSLAKKELLMEMLDGLSEDSGAAGPEAVYDRIASMSCKAAVKGNNRLSEQEADRLIDELLGLENPYACPHGRPTIISISKYEMEKKFKRIV